MNQFWTNDQKNFVKKFAAQLSDTKLAEKLSEMTGKNISKAAARKLRQRLGVKKLGIGKTFKLDD
jgi:hypothetical protein